MSKVTYGCTITRCRLDKEPTKSDIIDIRDRFYEDFHTNESEFPVNCFELKKNGWLHYHSTIMAPYINWKDVVYKGWSIKLKLLRTPYDLINWCGYVQKSKVDSCFIKITLKKVQRFKKDKAMIKSIPNITSFYDITNSE